MKGELPAKELVGTHSSTVAWSSSHAPTDAKVGMLRLKSALSFGRHNPESTYSCATVHPAVEGCLHMGPQHGFDRPQQCLHREKCVKDTVELEVQEVSHTWLPIPPTIKNIYEENSHVI